MHEHDSNAYKEFIASNNTFKFIPYAAKVLAEYRFNGYDFYHEIGDYTDVERCHTEIHESGILMDLYSVIADEVFFIMFNNRGVLLRFNYIVAQHMIDLDFKEPTGYVGTFAIRFYPYGFANFVTTPIKNLANKETPIDQLFGKNRQKN